MIRPIPCVLLAIASTVWAWGCIDTDGPGLSLEERIVPRARDGGAQCAPPGTVPDGHGCQCESDCVPGATCQTEAETGSPGGVCFRVCDVTADNCTPEATCIDIGAGPDLGACHAACVTNADCPPANSCHHGYCIALCQADEECLSGHCDLYRIMCTDGVPHQGAGLHDPCLRHDDCQSEFCHPGAQLCFTDCSLERQGCPEDAVCMPLFGEDTDMGSCFHPCTTTAECKDETFACVEFEEVPGQSICVPADWL